MSIGTYARRWIAVGYAIAIVTILPWQPYNIPDHAYVLIIAVTLTIGLIGTTIVAVRNMRKGN